MINAADYCTGAVGLGEDWNSNDRHNMEIGPVGIVRGNTPEVRAQFNKEFNEIVSSQFEWFFFETPADERDKDYYLERYALIFQDFYSLFDKFQDIPELHKLPPYGDSESCKAHYTSKRYFNAW